MRILFFYQYFGTPKGKWSTRVYELTRRWVEQGHKVTVVTSPYDKSDIRAVKLIEKQTIEGINLIIINSGDSNRFSILKRIWRFIVFSKLSVWFALTHPFDVAVASSGPITVGLPVIMAKWFRFKPYIFEVRDLWPQGAIEMGLLKNKLACKLALWFEKICYKNAKVVIGCSKGMTESINSRFPLVKTEIIPNASDIELFGRYENGSSNDQHKYFIYAGSLGAMDDVMSILKGVKLLNSRNVDNYSVIIIGDGAERLELENYAQQHHLNNVSFLGLIPKHEVVNWFHKATASFVCFKPLPVLNTVSPNKMFDSFAASVPIIQNTTGWISELVVDTDCGINVFPGDDESMANAIQEFIINEELCKRKAMAAFNNAETLFNRETLAAKYLEIIQKVLKD